MNDTVRGRWRLDAHGDGSAEAEKGGMTARQRNEQVLTVLVAMADSALIFGELQRVTY